MASFTKAEIYDAVVTLFEKNGRPVAKLEIDQYLSETNVVPKATADSIRGQLVSISKLINQSPSSVPIRNIVVDRESVWVPVSHVDQFDSPPDAFTTAVETVAPAFEKRPGVSLTVHRSCRYDEVIKLEVRRSDGWSERASWQSMHLHITQELIYLDQYQTKERGIYEVRITYRDGKLQKNDCFQISPEDWIILIPDSESD